MWNPRVSPVPAHSPGNTLPADLAQFAKCVVDEARKATGATGAAIGLRSAQGEVVCHASSGRTAPEPGTHFNTEAGISGECVRTGSLLICRDSENDPRVDAQVCRLLGVRSIVAVPVADDRSTLGILEVLSEIPGAFQDRHLEMLRQLARSAGAAIAAGRFGVAPPGVAGPEAREVSVEEDAATAAPVLPSIEKVRAWAQRSLAQRSFKEPMGLALLTRRFRWPNAAGVAALAVLALFTTVFVVKAWRSSASAAPSRASLNTARHEGSAAIRSAPTDASPPRSVRVFKTEQIRPPRQMLQNAAAVERDVSASPNDTDTAVTTVSSDAEPPRNGSEVPEAVTPPDVSAAVTPPSAGLGRLIAAPTPLPTLGAPVSQGVIPGKLEHMVQPVYPMWARERHVEGSVVLQVQIGRDGLVQHVDVVQGDLDLARAAVEAVRQWRYSPYQLNNQPVATTKEVTLNFKLE